MEDLLHDAQPGWVENKNCFERTGMNSVIGLQALQRKNELACKESTPTQSSEMLAPVCHCIVRAEDVWI